MIHSKSSPVEKLIDNLDPYKKQCLFCRRLLPERYIVAETNISMDSKTNNICDECSSRMNPKLRSKMNLQYKKGLPS